MGCGGGRGSVPQGSISSVLREKMNSPTITKCTIHKTAASEILQLRKRCYSESKESIYSLCARSSVPLEHSEFLDSVENLHL